MVRAGWSRLCAEEAQRAGKRASVSPSLWHRDRSPGAGEWGFHAAPPPRRAALGSLRGPEGGPGAKADAGGGRSWLRRAGDRTLASLPRVTGPAVLTAARRRSWVGVGNAGARREERRSGRGGGGSGVGDCGAPGGGAECARRARSLARSLEGGGGRRGVRWLRPRRAGPIRELAGYHLGRCLEGGGGGDGRLQFTDVITTRAWSC